MHRSAIKRPSVVVFPVVNPASLRQWARRLTVVVLPSVPVTEKRGTRVFESSGKSIFKDCTINSFEIPESHLNNITFENVGFDSKIVFRDSKLENIKLENITYLNTKQKINLYYHDTVEYISSDQFPTENAELPEID